MTKFCEGCPNKGQVKGDLSGTFSNTVIELPFGIEYTVVTAYDENDNPSRVFVVPPNVLDEGHASFIKNIIDSCNGPENGNCGSDAFAELTVPDAVARDFLRYFRQYKIGLKYK